MPRVLGRSFRLDRAGEAGFYLVWYGPTSTPWGRGGSFFTLRIELLADNPPRSPDHVTALGHPAESGSNDAGARKMTRPSFPGGDEISSSLSICGRCPRPECRDGKIFEFVAFDRFWRVFLWPLNDGMGVCFRLHLEVTNHVRRNGPRWHSLRRERKSCFLPRFDSESIPTRIYDWPYIGGDPSYDRARDSRSRRFRV